MGYVLCARRRGRIKKDANLRQAEKPVADSRLSRNGVIRFQPHLVGTPTLAETYSTTQNLAVRFGTVNKKISQNQLGSRGDASRRRHRQPHDEPKSEFHVRNLSIGPRLANIRPVSC